MRITLIGSGNVATHMGAAIKNAGHQVMQVYSRDLQHAGLLAYHLKAEPVNDLPQIDASTDLFIIAIKDDAIAEVPAVLARFNKPIVHTAGSVNIDALMPYTSKAGVLYPLQTFSKTKEVDFKQVPLCIEASDAEFNLTLSGFAQSLSDRVYQVDSRQRGVLHLAAVFACNFPNYLFNLAQQLLNSDGLDFAILRPLIAETAAKVQHALPADVQTGPAVRQDLSVIDKHLQMLHDEPYAREVYDLLSQGIIKMAGGPTQGS